MFKTIYLSFLSLVLFTILSLSIFASCESDCSFLNANSECLNEQCVFLGCIDGFANCDFNIGCEINTNSDQSSCGSCGNICPTSSTCIMGSCVEKNSDDSSCILGESVKCIKSGCVGNMSCNSGSYSSCECDDSLLLNIYDIDDDYFDLISLNVESNYLPNYCYFNFDDGSNFLYSENITFPNLNYQKLNFICGENSKTFLLENNINLDMIDNMPSNFLSSFNIYEPRIARLSNYDFGTNELNKKAIKYDLAYNYFYVDNSTYFIFNLKPYRILNNAFVSFQIPKSYSVYDVISYNPSTVNYVENDIKIDLHSITSDQFYIFKIPGKIPQSEIGYFTFFAHYETSGSVIKFKLVELFFIAGFFIAILVFLLGVEYRKRL